LICITSGSVTHALPRAALAYLGRAWGSAHGTVAAEKEPQTAQRKDALR